MTRTTTIRLLALAPAAWIAVALVHPVGDGTVYDSLRDQVAMWMGVHYAQLALSIGLAALLWLLVDGQRSRAATTVRIALPIYLVAFAAFDSVTGLGTGLAVHHANGIESAMARDAVAGTAEFFAMNRFTGDFSVLNVIAGGALATVIIGTALALRAGGARRSVWLTIALGVLLTMHMGPVAAIGAALLATGALLHTRPQPVAQAASLAAA
jgi:hypothetical protein